MGNHTLNQMAVFLRRCANGLCKPSCPYFDNHTSCSAALMRAAAELLEEVAEDDNG